MGYTFAQRRTSLIDPNKKELKHVYAHAMDIQSNKIRPQFIKSTKEHKFDFLHFYIASVTL